MGCDCIKISATATSRAPRILAKVATAPLQVKAEMICEREQNWAPTYDADGAELYDVEDKRVWAKKVELKTK